MAFFLAAFYLNLHSYLNLSFFILSLYLLGTVRIVFTLDRQSRCEDIQEAVVRACSL